MKAKELKVSGPESGAEIVITEGMVLEVLSMENEVFFVATVEKIKDSMIQIEDNSGAVMPKIEYNSMIKLRGLSKSTPLTMSGLIRGTSKDFWRIDSLKLLQTEERRQNFRQNTTLEGQVMCVNSVFGVENPNNDQKAGTFNCKVVDLSSTGVRLRTDGYFEKGDMLFLVDVRISQQEPALTATSIVRRVIENDGVREYGCEFYGLSDLEHEAIARVVLSIQRRELRARRAKQNS